MASTMSLRLSTNEVMDCQAADWHSPKMHKNRLDRERNRHPLADLISQLLKPVTMETSPRRHKGWAIILFVHLPLTVAHTLT